MTIPLITPLPSPSPSTDDPTNFDTRADALLGAMPTMVTEENTSIAAMNAAITQMNLDFASISAAMLVAADAAGFVALDTTSTLTVGAGTKTLHFNAARPKFAVNDQVAIVLRADPSIKMIGTVATFDGADDMTVSVVSGGVFGSGGPFSNWLIISGAFFTSGATAAEIRARVTGTAGITPQGWKDADAREVLTYASTVTPSLADGWHRKLEASASFTMGAPTNCSPGQPFVCEIVNTAGSVVLAVNGAWDAPGGLLGVIEPGNGARNKFIGFIDTVDGSGTMTGGTYRILRNLG